MRKIATVITGAGGLALMIGNAFALCPPDTIGPLNGVAAAESGPVGGPVDAAVAEAMSLTEVCAYVIEEGIPPAVVDGLAGEPPRQTEPLSVAPENRTQENRTYVTAYVDGQPVLVDPDTRAVVDVMK